MSNTVHTGTVTEAHAILQTERVKQIMAETGCTFSQACDQYIREKHKTVSTEGVSRASHCS